MSDLVTLSRKDCLRTFIGAKALHINVLCSDCCFVSQYRCIEQCCFLMLFFFFFQRKGINVFALFRALAMQLCVRSLAIVEIGPPR